MIKTAKQVLFQSELASARIPSRPIPLTEKFQIRKMPLSA
jgi:hypothetical protein